MGEVASPIRVLLADDHMVIREMLRLLFSQQEHIQLVGEAESCRDLLDCAALQQPDIIVLDAMLSDGNSIECIPQLKTVAPNAKIIMFSGTEDEVLLRRAVVAGALGWVRKTTSIEVLLRAIACVQSGEIWLERALVAQVLGEMVQHSAVLAEENSHKTSAPVPATPFSEQDAARIAALTLREREIIELIGQGLKNKQIAARLFLSEKTVHSHLASIFQKLELSDRLGLAVFAHRNGLLSSNSQNR